MSTSVSVICYKSKTFSNGEHPIMLRISKAGKRKYQSLGISVKPEYWDFGKNEPNIKCPNRNIIQKIILDKKLEYQKKILELNAEQKEYTASSLLENLEATYFPKTILDFYHELIDNFKKNGNTGNQSIYTNSLHSLLSFTHHKLNILFSDINVTWLENYENWLRKNKNKDTTISLLFRTLRSAYNKAIKAKATSNKFYPFKDFSVSKFNTITKKRAIDKEHILKIINTDSSNFPYIKQFAYDIFKFSYLCAGISFVDIANLTKDNIQNGKLIYTRQKTHHEIRVLICKQAMEIIKKYDYHYSKSGYLFPIFSMQIHKTPQQKMNRVHKVRSQINKELKSIAAEIGINEHLTTYVARHSFATVLKRSGVNIELISELMGHADISTTKIYLDSFENEQVDAAMKNLL